MITVTQVITAAKTAILCKISQSYMRMNISRTLNPFAPFKARVFALFEDLGCSCLNIFWSKLEVMPENIVKNKVSLMILKRDSNIILKRGGWGQN